MSSKIKKYDAWNTLVIWSPLGLLDFKVEFEEGVANLFDTSYLWPHCEELDELHGFHSYGICEVMEYTHRFMSFIHMHWLRWCKLRLCLPYCGFKCPTKERRFQINHASHLWSQSFLRKSKSMQWFHTSYFHFWPPTTPAETWCCKVPCSCQVPGGKIPQWQSEHNPSSIIFPTQEFNMKTMSFSVKKICNHSPPRNVTSMTSSPAGHPERWSLPFGMPGQQPLHLHKPGTWASRSNPPWRSVSAF